MDAFSRTEILIGRDALDRLQHSRVAVFGLGGVGGHACEALIRGGVGSLDLIDPDTVSVSNLNRQYVATVPDLGKNKAEVMKHRLLEINPEASLKTWPVFFLPDNADQFPFDDYDYIIDAVDTVTAKIELALCAQKHHVPIISAMGAGNKLDPTRFQVTDLSKTKICPLARTLRKELKKRGITHLKVVYSEEPPLSGAEPVPGENPGRRSIPGSISFVPPVVGMILAGEVIKDLIQTKPLPDPIPQ